MRITVASEDGNSTIIEVGSEEQAENIKALIEVELGIPLDAQMLTFNSKEIPDTATLKSVGVGDDDLLLVSVKPTASRGIRVSGNATLSDVLEQMGGNPSPEQLLGVIGPDARLMRELQHYNPDLAQAVASGDVVKVRTVIMMQQMAQHKVKYERQQEDAKLMGADLFDMDAQRKIEERIQQENIEQNMNIAMEEMPESFGSVFMLYVNCEVNGHQLKAFVDSGAQSTIMTIRCAERCGIMRLLDKRFSGMAKGVGTAKIVGRVHLAQIKVGGYFLGCTFVVMESDGVDLLFGLDMLRRHQCGIDLQKNVLRIGTTNEEVPFLSESELPESARLGREFSSAADEDMKMSEGQSTLNEKGSEQTEEALQNLVSLGFSVEKARETLQQCNGDAELAASLLYAADQS